MKHKIIVYSLLTVFFAGCAALEQRAVVSDGVIDNPALGFSGFEFEIPDGLELYQPDEESEVTYNDIQSMALRIHELNGQYHPRGNESFYEGFLMFSENTAFILITVTHVSVPEVDFFDTQISQDPQWQLMPLYNLRESRYLVMGENRLDAFVAKGTAYESKGWYYSKPKAARMQFSYEVCKVRGMSRDSYILMGFSLPEHEHILSLQMQEMMRGFSF